VHSAGQAGNRSGLGQAGNAFDQDVTVGEETEQQAVHEFLLSDDHAVHRLLQKPKGPRHLCYFMLDRRDIS
jgi:hypothetical protein